MKTFRPIHQDRHHRSSRRKSTRKYERQRNRASKRKEGQRILAKIKPQSTVITLEIQGKMLSSEGLAQELNQRMTQGQSDFVFVIGGSNGLHKDVLQRSNYALSFSKMTFPHQMMRVVLIEQVYRAFKIMRGEAYHK